MKLYLERDRVILNRDRNIIKYYNEYFLSNQGYSIKTAMQFKINFPYVIE